MNYRIKYRILTVLLCFCFVFSNFAFPVYATQQELLDEAEDRKNDPVESNEVENWPQGPLIGAKAAVLMDANTGAFLYCKAMDEELYPASITKLMTCLVAVENCSLDEIITVNQSAINANESDGSNMGLIAGEQLTLEELLYGILINSANEACNAVGEHIAGSIDGYVEMMNQRARELGCTHTHFVSTNGLHNDQHYTSAHDMALIAQAFFSYDILCKLSCISDYHLEENAYHEEHYLHSKNNLYEGRSYYYESLIGSKTGFTSHSRQTLVSCAEKNGMKLICVIMMEESPYQFEDTVNLFDYGFSNFSPVFVSNYDTPYDVNHSDFFNTDNDIFGSTSPLITMDRDSKIILPAGIDFSDTNYSLTYDHNTGDVLALVDFSYYDMYLGSASIMMTNNSALEFSFEDHFETEEMTVDLDKEAKQNLIFVNIYRVLIGIVIVAAVIIIVLIVSGVLKNFHFEKKRVARIKKRRRTNYKRKPVTVKRVVAAPVSRSGLNYRKKRKRNYSFLKKSENQKPKKRSKTQPRSSETKRSKINFDNYEIKS